MNSSKPAFIATVVVALLAVAAAVFAFWNIAREEMEPGSGGNGSDSNWSYRPPQELEDEMFAAAERLIMENHLLIRLYITHGLPVIKEPYANTTDRPLGNPPEDGLFYVDSADFKTIADIEGLVNRTFIPEEAVRVKNNLLDSGEPYYSDHGRIFAEKRANSDGITLGINEHFALALYLNPDFSADYPIDWTDVSFELVPLSAFECQLRIRLSADGEPVVFERRMTNYNNEGWRLDRLVHGE
ncbi:MAG: hypothetical protein LBC82_04015 [Oscillospiraceae bacterium]|jgi:hypothetical protein|nr:hypothetical protein [Oscillospiraceae bacterium]